MSKKTLCLFLHYSPADYFPLYVQYYINELFLHFDEVRMITNSRNIQTQPAVLNQSVQIKFVENEGYDFGMFYKGIKDINLFEYRQIACINDSNLLLKKLNFLFEWEKRKDVDFWGLVDSEEHPWFSSHKNNYHIQSHFIVFNTNAIALLPGFFEQIQPDSIFHEKDPKQLRRRVINDWELGVSQYLTGKNLKSATCFSSRQLIQKFQSKGKNVTHSLYKELLAEGYPLLKKKILQGNQWNFFNKKTKFKKMIEQYEEIEWDLEKVLDEIM